MVIKLFDELGPRFANRNGGYLRILKFGSAAGTTRPWHWWSCWTSPRREEDGKAGELKQREPQRSNKEAGLSPGTFVARESVSPARDSLRGSPPVSKSRDLRLPGTGRLNRKPCTRSQPCCCCRKASCSGSLRLPPPRPA